MTAAELLEAALGRAAAALEAGDALAAAEAMAAAGQAAEEARARGVRLEEEALARLAALHARCERGARQVRATLAQALEAAGTARRAFGAYRRP